MGNDAVTAALLILAALGIASLIGLAWLWRKVSDAPPGNLGDDE
jgi:hypothetical protein